MDEGDSYLGALPVNIPAIEAKDGGTVNITIVLTVDRDKHQLENLAAIIRKQQEITT